jgi:hypothetical protein
MSLDERLAEALARHGDDSAYVQDHSTRGPYLRAVAARVRHRLTQHSGRSKSYWWVRSQGEHPGGTDVAVKAVCGGRWRREIVPRGRPWRPGRTLRMRAGRG